MRICGFAAEGLRSERRIHETFPSKELQDYWASRPKYEDINHKSGDFVSGSSKETDESGTSGAGDGQSYQDWLAAQKSEDKEEPPPPPYSLEVDEAPDNQPQAAPPVEIAPVSASRPAASLVPTPSVPSHVSDSASASYQSQVPSTTGPPPINSSSRPQPTRVTANIPPSGAPHEQESTAPHSHQSYRMNTSYSPNSGLHRQDSGAMNTQKPYDAPTQQDPVASLTNDFDRHSISTSGPGRMAAASPPPLHPAHPAASSSLYGQTRPQSPQSRPQSQSHSRPTSQSGYTQQPSSPTTGQQAGTWSQEQWPPLEWKVSAASQQQPAFQQSSYPGQIPPAQSPAAGANLSRPHTITASSYTASSSSSLRPHVSVSGSSGRPHHYQTPPDTPGSTGASFSGKSSYQPSGPYAPTFPGSGPSGYVPGPPSHIPGGPSFPSSSTSPYSPISTYPGQVGSTYPGQPGYTPPIPGQGYANTHVHPSPPLSPSPGSSAYGGSPYPGQQPYNPSHGSSYPGQYPGSQGPNDSAGGFHFPQAQGGDQFGIPQPQPHASSYAPGYLGQQSSHQTSLPAPDTGGWYPGNSTPPVGPPMPPRESI